MISEIDQPHCWQKSVHVYIRPTALIRWWPWLTHQTSKCFFTLNVEYHLKDSGDILSIAVWLFNPYSFYYWQWLEMGTDSLLWSRHITGASCPAEGLPIVTFWDKVHLGLHGNQCTIKCPLATWNNWILHFKCSNYRQFRILTFASFHRRFWRLYRKSKPKLF